MEELEFFENVPEDVALHFASRYWVYTPAANDKHLVTLTGSTKLNFQGQDSANWRDARLRLHLNFPDICPPNKWFKIEHWAPFFTINAIDKGGDNHNGGWGVFDFGMELAGGKIHKQVEIWATLRVRGEDFTISRVGYSLTISGVFTEPPPGP
jgi:hypothetical protein